MKRGRPFEWTDTAVEELKALIASGRYSTSGAAKVMGLSRNAVIGKLHRLGISATNGEFKKTTEEELELRKQRKTEREASRQRNQARKISEPKMQSKVKPAPVFHEYLNIPFADLKPFSQRESNECRFIADEPPGPLYLACGNLTDPGKSYCEYCSHICYRTSPEVTDEERSRRAMQMHKLNMTKVISRASADIIDEAA